VLGDSFAKNSLYQVVVSGLNNPPQSQGLQFTITSFYDANIYLDRQICRSTFAFPIMEPQPVRQCLISVSAQLVDTSLRSLYTFQLQCQDDVRAGSVVYFLLPDAYNYYLQSTSQGNQPNSVQAC
jgi:hypothetical protein